MRSFKFILIAVLALASPDDLAAQHSIDVQRLAAKSDYLSALKTHLKMPRRKATTASTIAAARSAWALSLPEMATDEFDRALQDERLAPHDRARLLLSRGIIEFQEERFQIAIHFAERAVQTTNAEGPLRAKAWMLWAESLYQLGQFGAAEENYLKAVKEADKTDLPDLHYHLGLCRLKLGKNELARENFESVPLDHEAAPYAIRHLAHIALEVGRHPSASFWLRTGRTEFPDDFLDSWVDYALLRVAIAENQHELVKEIRTNAAAKYPPSDHWLTMLEAEAELYEWKRKSGSKEG